MRTHLGGSVRPSLSTRLLRGALTLPLALGLSATALAAPAGAATGQGQDRCPKGSLCVFSEPLFQGEMLIVTEPLLSLGSWDNRVRSFSFELAYYDIPVPGVCLYPKSGFQSEGARRFYNSTPSLAASEYPELDLTVSSIDFGREADDNCGWEIRYPNVHSSLPRPAAVPATGAFGDIDLDGYADVLSRNPFGQLWSAHDPDAGTSRLVGGGWNTMTNLTRHGDQDGDGLEDIYARDRAGVLWLYPGDGRGTFKPRRQVGGGWDSMADLAAAGDLTGDGKGDLLASDLNGVLWTYPGTGRGGFSTRAKVGGGWKTMNELLGAGDMNSDGKADLVARDTAGRLWLYPGNSRGAFSTRTMIGTGGWNAHKELLGIGDVTGDGHPDVVAHTTQPNDYGHPWLKVYPGTGTGTLRAPTRFAERLRSSSFAF
ncbi:FG-GAP-like repeat-containing protein [Streptomyces sp. NPDC048350]|uniref:FG-GAP-like repeat-containing protein n=1 Tax=Streptomyces sp. NPDC048350 TaxID=3365538 RepID=UPI00371F5CB1